MRLDELQQDRIIEASMGWPGGSLERFASIPEIRKLGWPLGVIEEWLWPFIDRRQLLRDYGHIDLSDIAWRLERVPTSAYLTMTTGASESDLLEYNAHLHEHWTAVRPEPIRRAWEKEGTWLTPPVVLDRALVNPASSGMQVLEGRTRVGILIGRARDGLNLAPDHLAWVGRRKPHAGRSVGGGSKPLAGDGQGERG